MPVLNEAPHVERALASIRRQQLEGALEILVLDGGSTDGTRGIVERIGAEDDRVRLLDNPARATPDALNAGLRAARGTYVVRMDAHTRYPRDYIARGIERLERGDVASVSGPQLAVGDGPTGRAVALALESPLGVGGARFRRRGTRRGGRGLRVLRRLAARTARRSRRVGRGLARQPGRGAGGAHPGARRPHRLPAGDGGGVRAAFASPGARPPVPALRPVPGQDRGPSSLGPAPLACPAARSGRDRRVRRRARPARTAAPRRRGALRGHAAGRGIACGGAGSRGRGSRFASAAALATMHLSWGAGFLEGCRRFGVPWRALLRLAAAASRRRRAASRRLRHARAAGRLRGLPVPRALGDLRRPRAGRGGRAAGCPLRALLTVPGASRAGARLGRDMAPAAPACVAGRSGPRGGVLGRAAAGATGRTRVRRRPRLRLEAGAPRPRARDRRRCPAAREDARSRAGGPPPRALRDLSGPRRLDVLATRGGPVLVHRPRPRHLRPSAGAAPPHRGRRVLCGHLRAQRGHPARDGAAGRREDPCRPRRRASGVVSVPAAGPAERPNDADRVRRRAEAVQGPSRPPRRGRAPRRRRRGGRCRSRRNRSAPRRAGPAVRPAGHRRPRQPPRRPDGARGRGGAGQRGRLRARQRGPARRRHGRHPRGPDGGHGGGSARRGIRPPGRPRVGAPRRDGTAGALRRRRRARRRPSRRRGRARGGNPARPRRPSARRGALHRARRGVASPRAHPPGSSGA